MTTTWPSVSLREVLKLDLDRVHVDPSETYPMVGVLSFGRGLFDREPIVSGNTSYRFFNRLASDHFVMSQLFGWEGALALSSEKFSGKYLSPQFPTFRCDPKRLDRRYFGYMTRRRTFWEQLGRRASGIGDRRRTLNPDALLSIEIPLPPLTDQYRIAEHLQAISSHVAEARRLGGEAERQVQALLMQAFWQVARDAPRLELSEVAPLVRRPIDVKVESLYPEVGIRSFGKGTFHKAAVSGLEVGTKRLFRIEQGDLLFSNVFAWEGAIAVAQPEDDGRYGSHRFISCVCKPAVALAEFLRFYCLTKEGLEAVGDASPGGAGRNRTLGLVALSKISVPAPSLDKQRWFAELAQKVRHQSEVRATLNTELESIIPSVLNRLLQFG